MTLEIDAAEQLRRPADLRRLIDAIVAADPHDEQDWLEWKSALDLRSKAGQFALSRAILGMANRDPDRAARHVGGLGYVVVGAQAGGADGVDSIDPAHLDDGLSRYLGTDGPQWSPHFLGVGGVDVLVAVVEAPAPGDPIHTLRASFFDDRRNGAEDGTIFVRRGAKTERASSTDVRMLTSRAQASRAVPPVGPPVSVIPSATDLPALSKEQVMAEIRDRVGLLARAISADRPSRPTSDRPFLDAGLFGNRLDLDPRSPQQFEAEVRRWEEKAVEAAWSSVRQQLEEAELGRLTLEIINEDLHNLHDVEISFRLPRSAVVGAFDEGGPPSARPPRRPRPYGDPPPIVPELDLTDLGDIDLDGVGLAGVPRSGVYIEGIDDDLLLTYVAGRSKPHEHARVGPAFLVLSDGEANDPIEVEWHATSSNLDGIRRGGFMVGPGRAVDPGYAARRGVAFLG